MLDLNNEELNLIVVQKFLAHALLGRKLRYGLIRVFSLVGNLLYYPVYFIIMWLGHSKAVGPF